MLSNNASVCEQMVTLPLSPQPKLMRMLCLYPIGKSNMNSQAYRLFFGWDALSWRGHGAFCMSQTQNATAIIVQSTSLTQNTAAFRPESNEHLQCVVKQYLNLQSDGITNFCLALP